MYFDYGSPAKVAGLKSAYIYAFIALSLRKHTI